MTEIVGTDSYGMPGVYLVYFCLVLVAALYLYSRDAVLQRFQRAALMNRSETRIFYQLRKALPSGWTVMTQVSYGAFLRHPVFKIYRSVMSKRADFVVLDRYLNVAAVLEYHGGGHYGRGFTKRIKISRSDRIKRRACAQAGIPLIELPAHVKAADIFAHVQSICSDSETPNLTNGHPLPSQSTSETPHAVSS